MGQSHLTADNLNANKVLLTIKNRFRLHVSVDSFAAMRSGKIFDIYKAINVERDHSVDRWGDMEYSIHLRPLLSEQEWMQFKKDILSIYAEQNSKTVALRKLVEFNWYRPLYELYSRALGHLYSCTPPCRDPTRDMDWPMRFLLYCIYVVHLITYMYVLLIPVVLVSLLLDILTLPRFSLFRRCHVAFLESVMVAHPELDPAVVEEELIQKIQQLAQNLSANHPGVHCRHSSSVVHHRKGSKGSYDEDVVEIQFFKFAPELEP